MASTPRTSPSRAATLRPVIVLVVICGVAALLLGAVHDVTAPVAQAIAEQRAEQTYATLVPEAASFEEVPCDAEGCTALLHALDAQGAQVATVVVAQAKGYGGPVPLAVAFGEDGTVLSMVAMANEETPGLGTRATEDGHLAQYLGLAGEPVGEDAVDFVSGATISSRAIHAAFNSAVAAYQGEVR